MYLSLLDFNKAFRMLGDLRENMNRAFEDFERETGQTSQTNYGLPARWYDDGESFIVVADVPGVAQEDLKVSVTRNTLSIYGKREMDFPEGYSVHRQERAHPSFSQSFTIPFDIDPDKSVATLKHGVLTLKVPRAESAKPKQISINVG